MPPAPFSRSSSHIEGVISVLSKVEDDAKIIAGGQGLIPLSDFRLARPRYRVDIDELMELAGIRRFHDGLTIGAMTVSARSSNRSPFADSAWRLPRRVVPACHGGLIRI